MVIDFYNRNGGGGGTADYATSAGTANVSNSTKLLEGGSAFPQSANTGDVVAVAPAPALLSTRGAKGLRSANTALGIYQYDGNDWNAVGGESEAYSIELSTPNPSGFTQDDITKLNEFFGKCLEDNSLAERSVIVCGDDVYRCSLVHYGSNNSGHMMFALLYSDFIESLSLDFANGVFTQGGIENNNIFNPYDIHGNVTGAGVYFYSTHKATRFDTLNDPDDLVIGAYQSNTFVKEKSIVTSTNIKRMLKITESDYAALISGGTVDEDTFYLVVPDPPQPYGVWTDKGEGNYIFNLTDTDPDFWANDVKIGTFTDVYWTNESGAIDMDVFLSYDGVSKWHMNVIPAGEGTQSNQPEYDFYDKSPEVWQIQSVYTNDGASSTSGVEVAYDGDAEFGFYSIDVDYPLSINTIDPIDE